MRAGKLLAIIVGLTACIVGLVAGTMSASATPGVLGGMSIADYCAALGYHGGDGINNTALVKGDITGPDFAYGNWACVDMGGNNVPIATTGPAPSMTDVCHSQYLGVASYALPSDPNDAYTWNCYLLPPSAGPRVGQETQAAVGALMSTDAIQAEIAQLQAIGPHPLQVELQIVRFLSQRTSQQLVSDVLGGYGLPHQQFLVSAELDAAMLRVVLHQP